MPVVDANDPALARKDHGRPPSRMLLEARL